MPYYTATVTNYVDAPSTDTAALRAASPAWLADRTISPLFMVNSLEDSMPYSQLGDMIAHLDALGVTNYQALSSPGGSHSLANWPSVKAPSVDLYRERLCGCAAPSAAAEPTARRSTSKKVLNVLDPG